MAIAAILKGLYEDVERNLAGVVADVDDEFLHDFRVALRRARSLLAQIKGALPEDDALRLRKELSSAGKMSNAVRDLDVFLRHRAEYAGMLPEALAAGLDEFFDRLAARRGAEHVQLAVRLRGNEFLDIMGRWRLYLERIDALPHSSHAAHTAVETAARRIEKSYAKVASLMPKLSSDSSDEAFHALRIECKKLRYLIEFFKSLSPPKKSEDLIARLKRLQDFLGRLNDLCVQTEMLGEELRREPMLGEAPMSLNAAAAVGGLMAALLAEKRHAKNSFAKASAPMLSEKTARIIKNLFTSHDQW